MYSYVHTLSRPDALPIFAVRTVLKLIADESDLNIVASDSVVGDVTLRLDNVPWDQALDIVLRAKGLDKRRSGNVVWVAPQVEIAKYEKDKADRSEERSVGEECVSKFSSRWSPYHSIKKQYIQQT